MTELELLQLIADNQVVLIDSLKLVQYIGLASMGVLIAIIIAVTVKF